MEKLGISSVCRFIHALERKKRQGGSALAAAVAFERIGALVKTKAAGGICEQAG